MKTTIYILSILLFGLSDFLYSQEPALQRITFRTLADTATISAVTSPSAFYITNTNQFTSSALRYYSSLLGFSENVQSLYISDSQIKGQHFLSLLFALKKLHHIEVTDTKFSDDVFPRKNMPLSYDIDHIEFRRSNPHKIVLDYLFNDSLKLKYLALNSCSLKVEKLGHLKNSPIFRYLEHLDLSSNEIDNSFFSLLPTHVEGNLTTLLLNNCPWVQEFRLSYFNQYTDAFPALSYTIHPEQPHVDWSAPLFKKLQHFEIRWVDNKSFLLQDSSGYKRKAMQEKDRQRKKYNYYIPKHAEALSMYTDTTLKKMKHFVGPVNLENTENFIFNLLDISSESDVLPASIQSWRCYNKLIITDRSEKLNEIAFEGTKWNEATLSRVLRPEGFPNLKYVSLRYVDCSEKEMESILHTFPNYQFSIYLYQNLVYDAPRVWPVVKQVDEPNKK